MLHVFGHSSMSEQDETNHALLLANQAGRMELSFLLRDIVAMSREKILSKEPYIKSFIDQDFSVKITGYWRCSFFVSLWTSTPSQSLNMQKKNLAIIQQS